MGDVYFSKVHYLGIVRDEEILVSRMKITNSMEKMNKNFEKMLNIAKRFYSESVE